MEVRYIVTHIAPHCEELVAIWAAIRFGKQRFQNINNAPVLYWDKLPEGKTSEELHREGYLLIGIGGGRYDEHPSASDGRKEGECAATLLAEDLGIRKDPALRKLFDFVVARDLKLGENMLELPFLIKDMWECEQWQPEAVMGWIFMALDAHYAVQRSFHTDAAADYQKAFKKTIVIGPGKKGELVSGRSSAGKFMPYARSRNAAIVVQMNRDGNVQIQTNQKLGIDLTDVARMIRADECVERGELVPSWPTLVGEEEVASWYFPPHRGMLLNGSKTKSAAPTKLSLKRIVTLIERALDPQQHFPPNKADACKAGRCTSSKQSPCPWFRMGLSICMSIRHNPSLQLPTAEEPAAEQLVTIQQ